MSNRHFPAMAAAFPEFDQSTLPPIPLQWVDMSWRGARFSDACPQFGATPNALAGTGVVVIINWQDRCGCGEDYIACLYDVEGECELLEEFGGDDWPALLEAVGRFQARWAGLLATHNREVEEAERKAAAEAAALAKAAAIAALPPLALREFPDYPADALPPLPTDTLWHDESWHNDMCPCYHSADGFGVWIDWPAAADRELIGSKRFCVFDYEENARGMSKARDSFECDTWEEVLAFINAARQSLGADIAKGFGDDIQEAAAWIAAMHKAGKAFHWEDSPYDIIETVGGNRTFTDAESILVNACRLRLYDFTWPEGTCPCGVSIALMAAESFDDMSKGYRERLAAYDLPQMSADDLWHEIAAVMGGAESAFITPERVAKGGLEEAKNYVRNFWTDWEERESDRSKYSRLFPALRSRFY